MRGGGDFNSAHKELGYPRTTAKGRNLLEEAENADFNLCTDASQPSRIGTSTVRDTTPDLAFIHAPTGTPARWKNTGMNLGSDHYIIEVGLELPVPSAAPRGRTHRMTDWNAFRELSTHTSCGSVVEWAAQVNETVRRATTETVTESDIPALDSRWPTCWRREGRCSADGRGTERTRHYANESHALGKKSRRIADIYLDSIGLPYAKRQTGSCT